MITKTCEYCGKDFQTYKKRAKYCSRDCYKVGYVSPHKGTGKKKYCIDCGKQLVGGGKYRCWDCYVQFNRGYNHHSWKGGQPHCIDCGETVYQGRTRCRNCYIKFCKGSNHPNWKGGRPNCIDCGVVIYPGRTRCVLCHVKYNQGRNHHSWKHGKPKCIDCGAETSYYGATRCKACNGKYTRGENSPSWKGGRTPLYHSIRSQQKYKDWRTAVYERDGYRCVICNSNKSGTLQAHHIRTFDSIIKEHEIEALEQAEKCEKMWDINNGVTLCKSCHEQINGNEEDHEQMFYGLLNDQEVYNNEITGNVTAD